MAETSPTPEEHALRRRARRRLVGAIALALLAVVVLPMVFDSEPRPMGNNVNVVMPSQNTLFEQEPVASAPTANPPSPSPETASHEAMPHPANKANGAAPAAAPKKTATVSKTKPKAPAKTKPKAPAKAAKMPAKPAYFLQLGSFANEANAKKMVAKARLVGFRSSIYHVNNRFKVRVGPIADKAKAIDYQNQLKTKGFSVLFEP